MVYRNNTGRLGFWLHQCVLRNTLAGSKPVVSTSRNHPVRAPQDLKGRALLEDPSEWARVYVVIAVRAAVSRMWDRDWLLGQIWRFVRYWVTVWCKPWWFCLIKFSLLVLEEGKETTVYISNEHSWLESAQGLPLGEVSIETSAKNAPNDGQDAVKTLRTIIWNTRACIR